MGAVRSAPQTHNQWQHELKSVIPLWSVEIMPKSDSKKILRIFTKILHNIIVITISIYLFIYLGFFFLIIINLHGKNVQKCIKLDPKVKKQQHLFFCHFASVHCTWNCELFLSFSILYSFHHSHQPGSSRFHMSKESFSELWRLF